MKKIKNYDNVFKQTILKLHENGKSLKELSREYGVSTQKEKKRIIKRTRRKHTKYKYLEKKFKKKKKKKR